MVVPARICIPNFGRIKARRSGIVPLAGSRLTAHEMNFHGLPKALGRAAASTFNQHHLSVAKAAAYSASLAVFPAMIFIAALLFRGASAATVHEFSETLGHVLPPGAHELLASYLTLPGEQSVQLFVGAGVVALWFASDMVASMMQAFHASYGLSDSRSVWKKQLLATGLVFLAVTPVGIVTGLMVFGHQIEVWLIARLGSQWWLLMMSGIVRRTVTFLGITLILSILYRLGAGEKRRWRDVWPGALLAGGLWFVATEMFTFYVQHVARYRDLYGNLATVVVLLVWLYVVALIAMIGCEFNVELERIRSPDEHE